MAVSPPKYTLLLVALVASASWALLAPGAKKHSTPEAQAEPPRAPSGPSGTKASAPLPPIPPEGDEAAQGTSLAGEVLEQIDVDKYSYLRIGEHGAQGTWAAVPVTTSKLGQRVRVASAQMMTNFSSATLKRTFDVIYFGVLDTGGATGGAARNAPVIEGAPPEPSAGPHVGAGAAAEKVQVKDVPRAEGPLGHTVAELYANKSSNDKHKVRVRAVVVKQTPGVFGKTFLHVRDGSGRAENGTNDLAVTTSGEPTVGSTVLLEGTFEVDKDFGSGYRYPAVLSDAVVVP